MVLKDANCGKFLWWKFIKSKEKIVDYLEGFNWCKNNGYEIKAVVSDGFKGLSKIIAPIPFQLYQFHPITAMRTKLTNHPQSKAGKELLRISRLLTKLNKAEFSKLLMKFEAEFSKYLNEKSINEQGIVFFTHRRLRSALRTLKSNLDLLFTYQSYPNILNTNNSLEASFNDLKSKIRNHTGLNLSNRMKFISWYFSIKNEAK